MGDPVKIIELAEDLISLSGLTPYEDIDIEIVGLRPGEKLYEELLCETEESSPTEHERIFINDLETINTNKIEEAINKLKYHAENRNQEKLIFELVELVDTYQPRRDNVEKIDFRKKKDA
jgi:FlaA1/EpsC-like NDP-sugar epimerase